MSGWIKLHRKMLEWEWYDDSNCFRVFTHLLLVANHKPNKWRGNTILRGQRLSSISKLSSETGLSVSQVRTAISKLESTGEIASQSQAQHTVFTIKNYNSYQSDDKDLAEESQADDKPIADQSQSNSKGLATNKNDKKDKNDQELKESSNLPAKADTRPSSKASEVFEYWVQVMGKTSSVKLNKKREAAINARFREGYTIDQIKQAIIGCSKTPHNMGMNDQGKPWNDIELICRNGTNVERFAENAIRPPAPQLPQGRDVSGTNYAADLIEKLNTGSKRF